MTPPWAENVRLGVTVVSREAKERLDLAAEQLGIPRWKALDLIIRALPTGRLEGALRAQLAEDEHLTAKFDR